MILLICAMVYTPVTVVSICGDGHHEMGDTMLGDPYIDNRTTTEKRLESKLGLLTVCQTFHYWSLPCAVDYTILMPTLWLVVLEHVGSEHRSLSSFSSGCRGRNLGLWWFMALGMMRHFSSVVDEREIFQFFYRYTTILNSGLLKVIQFKPRDLRILGVPALRLLRCGHVPARMGARRWHHNSWLVDYEQLKRPTTFSSWWRGGNNPLKWCGLPYVAVKARRLTGWPFGWWLEQGEVKI